MGLTESALAEAKEEMDGQGVRYLTASPVELLRERVASAIAHTSFYRELYEPFGPMPTGDGFLDWFARLPTVDKPQLQAVGPAALLNPAYNRSELVEKLTSGSTGIPFTLYLDPVLSNFRKWRFQRPYQRLLREPASKLVFIFPWDFVMRTPREEMAVASAAASPDGRGGTNEADGRGGSDQRDGREGEPGKPFTSLPKKTRRTASAIRSDATPRSQRAVLDRPFTVNSWLPLEQLFATLAGLEPATLVGFAGSVAAVARWMLENDQGLPSLKQVWTTSEILSPDGADAIRAAMGCEPLAIYASNEFGFMAWEAAAGGPMCFEPDRLHVEFIERHGSAPARVGEFARIVVTDLLNDTMPLIRYDIGDVARADEWICVADGLHSPTMTDLQGKIPDLLQAADGRPVTAFQVLGTIKDHLPDAQYRFIVLEAGRCVLQYRPGDGFSLKNFDATAEALKEIIGETVEIIPQQVDEIAREPSGKLRPLVNLQNVPEARRRGLAKELGVSALLSAAGGSTAASVVKRALTAIRAVRDSDTLNYDHELYADLTIDSLQFVRLVGELEREFGRPIDDEDLLEVDLITVGDLVKYVERLLAA
jgi:phenylacetate-CoA ligase